MAGNAEVAGRIDLVVPDSPVFSSIDPDAFAILARNLIENPLKHGSRLESVYVELSEGSVLRFANTGPAVSPDLLARFPDLSRAAARGRQVVGSGWQSPLP